MTLEEALIAAGIKLQALVEVNVTRFEEALRARVSDEKYIAEAVAEWRAKLKREKRLQLIEIGLALTDPDEPGTRALH